MYFWTLKNNLEGNAKYLDTKQLPIYIKSQNCLSDIYEYKVYFIFKLVIKIILWSMIYLIRILSVLTTKNMLVNNWIYHGRQHENVTVCDRLWKYTAIFVCSGRIIIIGINFCMYVVLTSSHTYILRLYQTNVCVSK